MASSSLSTGRTAIVVTSFLLPAGFSCVSTPAVTERAENRVVLEGVGIEVARAAAAEAIGVVLPEATISARDGTVVARSLHGTETRLEVWFEESGGSTEVVTEANRLVRECDGNRERPVVFRDCLTGEHPYTSTPCRVTHRSRTLVDRERDCETVRRADGTLERRVLEAIRATLAPAEPDPDASLPAVEPPSDGP